MKIRLVLLAAVSVFTLNAQAKDCSVSIFKTYMPLIGDRPICDDKNLPAEFAGDLTTLASGLSQRGYKATRYDQCANGSDTKAAYTLASQLGSCVQSGASMRCQLWVALFDNETNSPIYEKTIGASGAGSVTAHLSDALQGLQNCPN